MFKRTVCALLPLGLIGLTQVAAAQSFGAGGPTYGWGPGSAAGPAGSAETRAAHRQAMQNMSPDEARQFREQMRQQMHPQWGAPSSSGFPGRSGSGMGMGRGPSSGPGQSAYSRGPGAGDYGPRGAFGPGSRSGGFSAGPYYGEGPSFGPDERRTGCRQKSSRGRKFPDKSAKS